MTAEPTIAQIRAALNLAKAWRSTPRGPDTKGRLFALRKRRTSPADNERDAEMLREVDEWLGF